MQPRKKRSLKSIYLQKWQLPLVIFIASVCFSSFLAAIYADPVFKGGIGTFILIPPIVASLGTLTAAFINTQQKRNRLGVANTLTFIFSAIILIPFALLLSLSGMGT